MIFCSLLRKAAHRYWKSTAKTTLVRQGATFSLAPALSIRQELAQNVKMNRVAASAGQPVCIDNSSSQRAKRTGIGSLTPITFSSRHACDNAHSSDGQRYGSSASRSSGGRSVNGVQGERFSFTSLAFSPCRSSDRVRLPDLRSRPELLLSNLCGKPTVNAMLATMLTLPSAHACSAFWPRPNLEHGSASAQFGAGSHDPPDESNKNACRLGLYDKIEMPQQFYRVYLSQLCWKEHLLMDF